MIKTRGGAGPRIAVLALGFLAGGASITQADPIIEKPIIDYHTSGNVISTTGVTGTPDISFGSLLTADNPNFFAPSSFSLGNFQVSALPKGQTTTYTNTPFSISYFVDSVNGATPSPNQTPIVVNGVLNGSVSGANQSTVVATFNPLTFPNFQTGAYSNTLSITNSPLNLVPSTTNGGQTSVQAYLSTVAAAQPPLGTPEPTSIALFVTALGGLGLKRIRARKLTA